MYTYSSAVVILEQMASNQNYVFFGHVSWVIIGTQFGRCSKSLFICLGLCSPPQWAFVPKIDQIEITIDQSCNSSWSDHGYAEIVGIALKCFSSSQWGEDWIHLSNHEFFWTKTMKMSFPQSTAVFQCKSSWPGKDIKES